MNQIPPSDRMSLVQRGTFGLIVSLYLCSFACPVFDAAGPTMYGFEAFLWGLVGFIYLPMWLANPLFWLACFHFLRRQWKRTRNVSAAASVLAVSQVWMWDDFPEIGYFLWVGSMMVLTVFGAIGMVYQQKSAQPCSAASKICSADGGNALPAI